MHKTSLALACLVCGLTAAAAPAAMIVNFGTVSDFSSTNDLDLSGNVIYALNFTADAETNTYTVQGVPFLPHSPTNPAPGVTSNIQNSINNWVGGVATYTGPDAAALSSVMHDIRWSLAGNPHRTALQIVPGNFYKLQLLFHDNTAGDRLYDIVIDGNVAVDEFDAQNGSTTTSQAFTWEFQAVSNLLTVELGDFQLPNTTGVDRNPILNGLILTQLPPPPPLAPEPASIVLFAAIIAAAAAQWLVRRRRLAACPAYRTVPAARPVS